jgi:hypothetical protein
MTMLYWVCCVGVVGMASDSNAPDTHEKESTWQLFEECVAFIKADIDDGKWSAG